MHAVKFLRKSRPFIVFSALVMAALVAAQDGSLRAQTAAPMELVHPGDLIDVDVVGSLEYDWRGGLTPEGFLDGFDKVENQVFALCRTEAELSEAIRTEYARFLREPQVIVRVLDRSNRPEARLEGAVKVPHRFQIRREVRLTELIALAGGITDSANGDIVVFRPAGLTCDSQAGGPAVPSREARTINVKIGELLKGGPETNSVVRPGDIVTIVPAWPVYVIGGVNNPLQISLRSELSLSRAVASAGGVSKDGTSESVTIFRRKAGQTSVIQADLKSIESGNAEDIRIEPFDVIDVGQRGRAKRQFPPVVESGLGTADSALRPLRVID